MYYKNIVTRFLFRKNFIGRVRSRLRRIIRRISKDEIDDIATLYKLLDRSPEVIVDAGANIGFVTYQFLKRFPQAALHSFEPNPLVFEVLENSYKNDARVTCVNAGLGENSGRMVFNINKNSGTSSFMKPNEYHNRNFARKIIEEKEVEVFNLSDYLDQQDIRRIDVLKLDVEGFELATLKGIRNLTDKVDMVFSEVNLIPTYEGQPLMEDICGYLRSKGFHMLNFYGINENKYNQAMISNVLFINERIRKELSDKVGEKYFGY